MKVHWWPTGLGTIRDVAHGDSVTAWQRLSGSFVLAGRFVICGHLAMLVDGRLTESDLCWHHNLAVPAKFEVMVPVPVGERKKRESGDS